MQNENAQLIHTMEGWVARDGFYTEPLSQRLHFFINEPHRSDSSRPYEQRWYASGLRSDLPSHFFPELNWSNEPVRVRIEIWTKEERRIQSACKRRKDHVKGEFYGKDR